MTTTYFVLTELPPFFDLEPISKSGAGFLVILDRIVKLLFYYFHLSYLVLKLNLENDKSSYTTFLVQIAYDPNLPFYFNNHHKFIKTHLPHLVGKNGLFEKRQIQWMTFNDMQQKRLHFRHYYRPMLDQLKEHEAHLRKSCVNIV